MAVRRCAVAALAVGGCSAWFVVGGWRKLLTGVAQTASLRWPTIVGALAVVAMGVVLRAVQAKAAYRIVALPAPLGSMVRLSAVSYAANKVTKSGGAAGILPYLGHARDRGHGRGDVIGAYVCMQLASMASLCLLITVAVATAAFAGALHGAVLGGAIGGLVYAACVLTVLAFGARRGTVDTLAVRARRLLARCYARFGRQGPRSMAVGRGIGDAMEQLRTEPARAAPLLLAALGGKLLGACGLLIVLSGLHAPVGAATALLVYALTVVAATIGPLPGGAGAAEASLAGLLVASGASAAIAAAAVVAFRFLDLWLPLLVGVVAGITPRRGTPVLAVDAIPAVLEPAA